MGWLVGWWSATSTSPATDVPFCIGTRCSQLMAGEEFILYHSEREREQQQLATEGEETAGETASGHINSFAVNVAAAGGKGRKNELDGFY